jgi:hypothetical protein
MAADLYGNYTARLTDIDNALVGNDFSGAFSALARAKVALAALPAEILIGQQMTRFVALKQLDELSTAITEAEEAYLTGGGTGVGLVQTIRAY